MADNVVLRRDAPLTPVADKRGHEVTVCMPDWFDEKKKYKIANAPKRTADLEFTGSDLNFMARVLYAEASGSEQLPDKAVRDKEKAAIMNVNHFRLNRRGYPSKAATTFYGVCKAKGQFESVFEGTDKFVKSDRGSVSGMKKKECADLDEAIDAVRTFMATGPSPLYPFDNFRGYDPKGRGTHIGRSRFMLSPAGKKMMEETP